MYEIKEARIQLREGLPLYSSKAIKGSKDVAKLLMKELTNTHGQARGVAVEIL